jgi:hypothetical protein
MPGRGKIDDREPAMPQRYAGCRVGPGTRIVWATMRQRVGHGLREPLKRFGYVRRTLEESGYAAHWRSVVASDVMADLWPSAASKTRTVHASTRLSLMNNVVGNATASH